jgi:hypothetical protein
MFPISAGWDDASPGPKERDIRMGYPRVTWHPPLGRHDKGHHISVSFS